MSAHGSTYVRLVNGRQQRAETSHTLYYRGLLHSIGQVLLQSPLFALHGEHWPFGNLADDSFGVAARPVWLLVAQFHQSASSRNSSTVCGATSKY